MLLRKISEKIKSITRSPERLQYMHKHSCVTRKKGCQSIWNNYALPQQFSQLGRITSRGLVCWRKMTSCWSRQARGHNNKVSFTGCFILWRDHQQQDSELCSSTHPYKLMYDIFYLFSKLCCSGHRYFQVWFSSYTGMCSVHQNT